MDPFPKDDPLYHLLGKTRPVEPRPNFTQNVMRTVRNTPQQRGWWANFVAQLESHPRLKLATATAAIAIAAALLLTNIGQNSANSSGQPLATNPAKSAANLAHSVELTTSDEATVASELDNMDQLSDLLASQDTSSLTDGEIAMLLY